jgi:hypothetical protein
MSREGRCCGRTVGAMEDEREEEEKNIAVDDT